MDIAGGRNIVIAILPYGHTAHEWIRMHKELAGTFEQVQTRTVFVYNQQYTGHKIQMNLDVKNSKY